VVNHEIEKYLNNNITQFKKLGLNLNLTKDEFFLLKSQLQQIIVPNTNKPYSSDLGNPLSYYLFEPHEDSRSTKSVLLLGGIHPDEIAPLYTTWKLLISYLKLKNSSTIKNRIIFVPLLNPDCFIGSGQDGFIPSRIKNNCVDLNRDFYNPRDVKENLPEFHAEPEIDFLLHLIKNYDPSHFVVMHSALNLLELDGYSTKEDREWINRVHEESGRFGGPAIPIKKHETYAGKQHKHWSFGHFIKVIQKSALTFEYPEPKKSSSEAIKQDAHYRKSVQMALDIEGISLENYRKETELIKNMSLKELANYAHNHYGHPSKELYVIGITGTNGKTTVSYLMGEVLKAAGHNPFVLGTLNSGNRDLSTPEALDTLRLMRMHLDQGGTHFVMEVTSEGIDQSRILGIDFNIKILTNITQDHLDYHKTFEHYKKTKLEFMTDGDGHKIYPKDFEKEPIYFSTLLLGHFNLLNIKATACAIRYIGIEEKYIQKSLSSCSPPRGRLENVEKGQLYMVIVDYAHTPDALENVLNTVKEISSKRNGKLFVLFGCGGNRDTDKRPKMGRIASEIADYMVITDDNPRSEPSKDIMNEIVIGLPKNFKDYTLIQDRKKAIDFIVNKAQDKDVVILVGKGHETYQILKLKTIHFDDREEASEAILLRLKNEALNNDVLIE
jgi:UDP-N-acetylmuramoyl-L-alanyl-D-glutamate--2,6-diaminopimelate ligase